MEVKTYFDQDTATFTHLVWDDNSRQAAIIDPVLDYNHRSGKTGTLTKNEMKVAELPMLLSLTSNSLALASNIFWKPMPMLTT